MSAPRLAVRALVATPIRQVLELARWAPSGDNTQVWRFRLLGPDETEIIGHDTRDDVVYDRDGQASHISLGTMLETARIAASTLGRLADIVRSGGDDRAPRFHLRLGAAGSAVRDPLATAITSRCTNRGCLSTRPINPMQRAELDAEAARSGHGLRWFPGWRQRLRMARLMTANARVRLTCAEAFAVHRAVLDFADPLSADRVPAASLPADPILRRLMPWAMAEWSRTSFLNRWAMGTLLPRLEMDLLPALVCGAHVVLVAPRPAQTMDDHLATGAALQRVWLRATLLGLQLQPEYTPLAFAGYVWAGRRFTRDAAVVAAAQRCTRAWERLAGADAHQAVFIARLGFGRAPASRSLRRTLAELMVD